MICKRFIITSMLAEITSTPNFKLLITNMLIVALLGQACWAKRINQNDQIVHAEFAYMDKHGNTVFRLPPDAKGDNFSDGLVRIKQESKRRDEPDSSYMDRDGKVVAEGFIDGDPFSEGLAKVGRDGKVGFIGTKGDIAISRIFSDALGFREGLAPVQVNKGFGFIDRTGKIIVEPFFENVSGFSEGLAAVQSQGEIGFIDKAGKWRIKPQFDYVDGFSDGVALVRHGLDQFYIDQDGRRIITLSEERWRHPFVPWGVSETGLHSGTSFFTGFQSRTFANVLTFKDGLSPMCENNKYGFINKSGEFIIPAKFRLAFPFVEGLARVRADDKYGFIDKTGSFVVKPKFRDAADFSEGAAAVAIGHNQWGQIDKNGRFIVKPKYLNIGPFHDGRALVQLTGYFDDHIDDVRVKR